MNLDQSSDKITPSTGTLNVAGALLPTTPLAVGGGGTGITTLTAGYIPYGNGTSAFASSSTLQFDGTKLSVTNGILINSSAFAYTDNTFRVQGGTVFAQKTANVTTSATLVVSGVAGMFVIRDNNVGGTALVLLDAITGVTIVSQQGSIFTTSSPSATQIQLGITSSPNYGMTALAGSTRNGDQINIGAVICQ